MKQAHCSEKNLDTLKHKIKQQWKKIEEEDLENLQSISMQIKSLLMSKYRYSEKKAEQEMENFFDSSEHRNVDVNEHLDELKATIDHYTNELFNHLSHGEEEAEKTVKSHLLPSLGIIAVIGFIFGSYITNKFK